MKKYVVCFQPGYNRATPPFILKVTCDAISYWIGNDVQTEEPVKALKTACSSTTFTRLADARKYRTEALRASKENHHPSQKAP